MIANRRSHGPFSRDAAGMRAEPRRGKIAGNPTSDNVCYVKFVIQIPREIRGSIASAWSCFERKSQPASGADHDPLSLMPPVR